jgi:hypothetical protein
MAQLLQSALGILLCLACHPARPPATFAGGGWLPLVAVIQCFIQGVTGTRLLLYHHVNLVRKSCLLLDRQGADFCAQLGQGSINFVDLVLRGSWR